MPAEPALENLKQEGRREVSLGYRLKPCLMETKFAPKRNGPGFTCYHTASYPGASQTSQSLVLLWIRSSV